MKQLNTFRKILILGLGTALIGGFVLALPVQAYSPDKTHAPLAGKSVDLYNNFYGESLTEQEKEWIMWGSIHEDYRARPMNHFYDPINNAGLPGYLASKLWVHNHTAQTESLLYGGNYTWEEALAAYKRGDKEKAYKALGHVIHLVQDAAVPAHTRNDPHPHGDFAFGGADSLEQGVKGFGIPSITGLSPVIYSELGAYFDNTALYTNTHFYSKNSVGFYEKPVPTRMDRNYVYGREGVHEYRLVKFQKPNSRITGNEIPFDSLSLDDPLVLQDYWNRLAPLSVENGAGIIHLFHGTAEEDIIVNEAEEGFWDKTKSWFSNSYNKTTKSIGSALNLFWSADIFGSSTIYLEDEHSLSLTTPEENNQAQQYFYSQLQDIAPTEEANSPEEPDTTDTIDTTDTTNEIDKTDTTDESNNSNPAESQSDSEADSSNSSNDTNNEEETKQEGEVLGDSSANDTGFGNYGPTGPNGREPVFRQQNTIPPADLDHLVINEAQTHDSEFIELYNPTDSAIDLSGHYFTYYSSSRTEWNDPWRVKQFPETAIPAQGYFLIGLEGYPEEGNYPASDWQPYSSNQLSNSNGTVAIFSEDPKEAENPEPVDAVGWGADEDVTLKETQVAQSPATTKSISRSASHADTDNNSADFSEQDPTPTNSAGQKPATALWSESISSTLNSQMLTDADSNLYLAAGDTIQKFTPEGTSVWEDTRPRTYVATALSPDEENLYAVECERNEDNSRIQDCYFTAFNTQDGEEVIERVSIGRRGSIMQPVPDSANGNVYIVGKQKVYALNISTEDILVWEKFNYELGGGSINGFGTIVVHGDNLYMVKKESTSAYYLAVVSKNTGELLNYLRLDVGSVWHVSTRPVAASNSLILSYTGAWCGASKRSGLIVFDISELEDMENSATPTQTLVSDCSGKMLRLQGNGGEGAYMVPFKSGAYSQRYLSRLFDNGDGEIESSLMFTVNSPSNPSGKLFVSADGKAYLFTEEESGSTIYGLTTNPEDNPALQYNSEDEIKNLAAGEGILYYLTATSVEALEI